MKTVVLGVGILQVVFLFPLKPSLMVSEWMQGRVVSTDSLSFNELWQCGHVANTLWITSNRHPLKPLRAQNGVFIYKDTELLLKAQQQEVQALRSGP